MEIFTLRRDEAKKRYDDLRKRRLDEFMAGFTAISQKLKEMYQVCCFEIFILFLLLEILTVDIFFTTP